MIRINLLGAPKPKNKRGGGSSAVVEMNVGGGISPFIKVVAVLAIAGLANAGYWYRLNAEKDKIAQQTAAAQRKNQELSQVKARYLERQREAEAYKRRVDVIDQFRQIVRRDRIAEHAPKRSVQPSPGLSDRHQPSEIFLKYCYPPNLSMTNCR